MTVNSARHPCCSTSRPRPSPEEREFWSRTGLPSSGLHSLAYQVGPVPTQISVTGAPAIRSATSCLVRNAENSPNPQGSCADQTDRKHLARSKRSKCPDIVSSGSHSHLTVEKQRLALERGMGSLRGMIYLKLKSRS